MWEYQKTISGNKNQNLDNGQYILKVIIPKSDKIIGIQLLKEYSEGLQFIDIEIENNKIKKILEIHERTII